jgi:hypothetical protein
MRKSIDRDSQVRNAPERAPGDVIVLGNAIGTLSFVITALTAAIVFSTAAQWVGAVTAMGLFAVGVFAFLWAFYNAVQRSREEEISVTQIYLLLGPPTPSRVRWTMLGLLLVQCVTAMATALARPNGPDGSPGSSLAVGILVPMFGIGLNGLWCAFHGVFEPRVDPAGTAKIPVEPISTPGVAPDDRSIDKNEGHG